MKKAKQSKAKQSKTQKGKITIIFFIFAVFFSGIYGVCAHEKSYYKALDLIGQADRLTKEGYIEESSKLLARVQELTGDTNIREEIAKIKERNEEKKLKEEKFNIVGPEDKEYVKDEIIIKYKEKEIDLDIKKGEKEAKDFAEKENAEIKENVESLNISVLKVGEDKDSKEEAVEIGKNPEIEYAEPNYVFETTLTPNDSYFNNLWGLHNIGQSGGVSDADIDAPEAWNFSTGSSNVVIAVTDTGVNYNHTDLQENIWENTDEIAGNGIDDDSNGYVDDVRGWDFYANDNDPMDEHGHGTHVSGTIAAVGNNSKGVAGVNWSAKIMPLTFLGPAGYGYISDAAEAVDYAVRNGAKVINASWGGGGYSRTFYDVLSYANNNGVLFVASAGNLGSDNDVNPSYPASYDLKNIISVAATDKNDNIAYFSCYGAETVDVGAPGVYIYSTVRSGGYGYMSGTSMAAPHVAGLAGLIWANDSVLDHYQVKQRILWSGDKIEALKNKTVTGRRINAVVSLRESFVANDYGYSDEWVGTNQTVNLSLKDPAKPVSMVKYCLGKRCDPSIATEIFLPFQINHNCSVGQDLNEAVRYQSWDTSGDISVVDQYEVKIDKRKPVNCSVILASGAKYVKYVWSVPTALRASDLHSGVEKMRFSLNGSSWSSWENYKKYTLVDLAPSGTSNVSEGTKRIYAQFKDAVGNIAQASDTVIYDKIRPAGSIKINNGVKYTRRNRVDLSFAASDNLSGINKMTLSNKMVNKNWINYKKIYSDWNLADSNYGGSNTQGRKYVSVMFRDRAKNKSLNWARDSIIYDRTRPSGSIKINNGARKTNSRRVTLNLKRSDNLSGVNKMRLSNNGRKWTSWKQYVNNYYKWNLTNLNYGGTNKKGRKYVYVQYRDRAKNISTKKLDYIIWR